jgi:hypothetical protein
MPTRRLFLASLAPAPWIAAHAQGLEPVAVVGFELVDEQPDPARDEAMRRRLASIQAQLEKGLAERGLYRVVDIAPAKGLVDAARASNAFVYRCNGCLAPIGERLNTRLVIVGWVQRVSELILNINVAVKDAKSGVDVLTKSVDLRGNNDESFSRGMNFMLRDWAERRQRNPSYGL